MRHFQKIFLNTLFVANAYLPNYIPNNLNALIMLSVYDF